VTPLFIMFYILPHTEGRKLWRLCLDF